MSDSCPIDRLDQADLRKLALVASRTDNCVIITNPQGLIEWVNDGFTRLTGYHLDEVIGKHPGTRLQGPKTDPRTREAMRGGVRSGIGFKAEVLNYRKDGSEFWISMQVQPVKDDSGQIIQFIGIGIDISDRKRQDQVLRESEDRFRNIVNTAQEGIWLIDAEARTTYANDRMAAMLGYRVDEMMGKTIYAFMDEQAIKLAEYSMERRRSGIAENHDFRLLRRDGSDLWTMMATNPVFSDDKTFIGALALVTDITERRAAETILAEAHAENELILSTIPHALIGLTHTGLVCRWNDAAERVLGIPRAHALGKELCECGLPFDCGLLAQATSACLSEKRQIDLSDIFFRRRDGSDGALDVNIVSRTSSLAGCGDGLCLILMVTDITDRKHQEAQRQQGQKLESIGQLAAGVAHEINTPIQFIGDNLRFLGDSFADLTTVLEAHAKLLEAARSGAPPAEVISATDAAAKRADVGYLADEIPKALTQSLEGVTRVADIVRAMKEFSHPDQGTKKPTDLNKTITTTLTVARNEYKYVADLVTEFASDLPQVLCIASEFNQVVLNLVVNAAHAIADVIGKQGGKGTITVSTRRDGDHAEVRIRDSGTGIPDSALAKIFEPFFTTKAVGKGTGQGLYIAHNVIAKKHGGTLTFETEMGKGTTFIIRLPLTEKAP